LHQSHLLALANTLNNIHTFLELYPDAEKDYTIYRNIVHKLSAYDALAFIIKYPEHKHDRDIITMLMNKKTRSKTRVSIYQGMTKDMAYDFFIKILHELPMINESKICIQFLNKYPEFKRMQEVFDIVWDEKYEYYGRINPLLSIIDAFYGFTDNKNICAIYSVYLEYYMSPKGYYGLIKFLKAHPQYKDQLQHQLFQHTRRDTFSVDNYNKLFPNDPYVSRCVIA
jgi:hypothetical protein